MSSAPNENVVAGSMAIVIPDAAVEAAGQAIILQANGGELDATTDGKLSGEAVRAILEAALPHMLEAVYELGWDDGRAGTRSAVRWAE